jgi:monoamine oxidase
VDAMRDDLRALGTPTAESFTPEDAVLDFTNLQEYLETRGAGTLIKAVLDVAYTIEYGLEIDRQSCINFLLFIHADRPLEVHAVRGLQRRALSRHRW